MVQYFFMIFISLVDHAASLEKRKLLTNLRYCWRPNQFWEIQSLAFFILLYCVRISYLTHHNINN